MMDRPDAAIKNQSHRPECPVRLWLMVVVLIGLVAAVYLQVARHDFINYDDPEYITDNPQIQQPLDAGALAWAFRTTHASNYHPLTWLSHILDYNLYGMNPAGHHLASVLIHAASVLLLFALFCKLTGREGISFFVAAVFAVHPLHVESVAWVAERKDVLSTCFGLLSILAYVWYARKKHISGYVLSLIALALGLLAKPMLVTLPAILILLDYWPLKRFGRGKWRTLFAEKIPFFILAVASGVMTFVAQHKAGAVSDLVKMPLSARLANAVISYAVYIYQTLVPTDLAPFYPHPLSYPRWQIIVAAAFLIVLTVAVFYLKRRYLIVGWLWYLIMLAPVIGIVQVGSQARADRYMYLPMTGLVIMLAFGLDEIARTLKNRKPLLTAAAAASIGALAIACFVQVRYWRNSETLFTHTLAVTQDNHVAHLCLGNVYFNRKDNRAAAIHFEQAVRISPQYTTARSNLGMAYFWLGRYDKAIEQFERVLEDKPNHAQSRYYLAHAYNIRKQYDKAAAHFGYMVEHHLASAEVYLNLGAVLAKTGAIERANASYRTALQMGFDDADPYLKIGAFFFGREDLESAGRAYAKVLQFEPDHLVAHGKLGLIDAQRGRYDQALAHFYRVIEQTPEDVDMLVNIAAVLQKQAKPDQAKKYLEKALQIEPDNPRAKKLLNP